MSFVKWVNKRATLRDEVEKKMRNWASGMAALPYYLHGSGNSKWWKRLNLICFEGGEISNPLYLYRRIDPHTNKLP